MNFEEDIHGENILTNHSPDNNFTSGNSNIYVKQSSILAKASETAVLPMKIKVEPTELKTKSEDLKVKLCLSATNDFNLVEPFPLSSLADLDADELMKTDIIDSSLVFPKPKRKIEVASTVREIHEETISFSGMQHIRYFNQFLFVFISRYKIEILWYRGIIAAYRNISRQALRCLY